MLQRPPHVLVTLATAVALMILCLAGPVDASPRQSDMVATLAAPQGKTASAGLIACQFKTHIWVMNRSGGARRQITQSVDYNPAGQTAPAWSPDGKRLAYLDLTGVTDGTGSRLWMVDADGTNEHRVNVLGGSESLVLGVLPAWSPDGQRIAFANTMNLQVGDPEKSWVELFYYDFTTGQTTQVYRAPRGYNIEGLTWSMNGRKIEFSIDNWAAVQSGRIHGRSVRLVSKLRLLSLASHRIATMARAPRHTYFTGVARSPSGRAVAVVLSRQSGSRRAALLTGPVGGRPRHTVVKAMQASTQYLSVSWSPSARQLAYGISTPNGRSVWIIGANGKSDHKILAGASFPVWGPR